MGMTLYRSLTAQERQRLFQAQTIQLESLIQLILGSGCISFS